MRIWRDANGGLITDEQLLRHLAMFGSLSGALQAGDISLVIVTDETGRLIEGQKEAGRRRSHAKLATLL